MNWYAAHIVLIVRLEGVSQRRVPAWENIVLIKAGSEHSAIAKAQAIGAACAGDEDGTFRWGGKAATWEFVGVRKVTECALAKDRPASGDEISYQELEFNSLAEAKRYGRGAAISVLHNDQIRIVDEAALTTVARPKRKRA